MGCTLYAIFVSADTIYVSPDSTADGPGSDWSNAFHQIDDAVEAAADDDVVLVTNGYYALTSQIFIPYGITVRSVNGRDATVVDGTLSTRCFYLQDSNAVVDGFTITGGVTPLSEGGGGVWCDHGGIVRNCRIMGNSAGHGNFSSGGGGGVYLDNGGVVENCLIFSNSSTYFGGGVACYQGGTVRGCTISNNWAEHSGGGISCAESGVVEACVIANNHAIGTYVYGGGVLLGGGATLRNCIVIGNEAIGTDYGRSGGIELSGVVVGCVIVRNFANTFCGGVFLSGGATVESSTICSNSAAELGDASCYGSDNSVVNSIIYSNTGDNWDDAGNEGAPWSYCCMTPAPTNGVGNITNDPGFVSAALDDWRLRSSSPCIDAGTNIDWMLAGKDIDGHQRIFNTVVDIGAYEASIIGQGISTTGGIRTVWDCVVDARCQLQCATNVHLTSWQSVGGVVTASEQRLSLDTTNEPGDTVAFRLLWLRP